MQLGGTRLSPQERDRCMSEGCCLYGGGLSHLRATCPELMGNARAGQATQSPSVTTLHPPLDNRQHYIQAFVDFGAVVNFIDQDFARELQIPCVKCPIPLQIEALDGRPIGSGQDENQTKPILQQVRMDHSETLSFLLITAHENPLILGYPWLVLHNSLVSWSMGHLLDWG
jgi:hypothetical protein